MSTTVYRRVRIFFYPTFIQSVPFSLYYSIFANILKSSLSIVDRAASEGAQSARPPTFRAGGPALFICYLLYAINTLGYSHFAFV